MKILKSSPDAAGRRMPGCRTSDARPPVTITVKCWAAGCCRYRSPSDDGPPPVRCRMLCAAGPVLVGQNLYTWLGNLHF